MKRKAGILVAVCAAVLAINLDTTIVNVALPSIARELGAGTRQLQWVVDGYNLAFAALVLAAGSLSDRFGRRPALIVGLVGFAGREHRRRRWSRLGRRPDRRSVRDGRLRGADLPDDAVDHQQHLPRAAGARRRARRLGRRRRRRRRDRPGRRAACCSSTSTGAACSGRSCRSRCVAAGSRRSFVPESRDPSVPRARPARPGPLGRDARPARLHDHRGARAAAGRRRPRSAASPAAQSCSSRSSSSSGEPLTRCSTSPSSPTGGSAPRAAP